MQEPIQMEVPKKILDLMKNTGYPLVQTNGQRVFGPPKDWVGRDPPRGCEVFVGKLPRDVYEDELVPVFSKVGKIYKLRLMMDFSGSNRGYAFVSYGTREEASAAIEQLHNYQIRTRRHIAVVASVDNSRLYIGNIPKHVTKDEVLMELSKRVDDIVQVIMYENCYKRNHNRGYVFVEFVSHRAAAMARRVLVPGCFRIWNRDLTVDWAEPEPEVDDDQMRRVRVLYARNFDIQTTPAKIKDAFESAINTRLEKVTKLYDYAFIHFYKREHAAQAKKKLENTVIDGRPIQIKWAKPVNRQLYRLQKQRRGNGKFNLSCTQSLCYTQLLNKEDASSPRDEGLGSSSADCLSPIQCGQYQKEGMSAPAILEAMCNRYLWAQPNYKFYSIIDAFGKEKWICSIELSHVGTKFFRASRQLYSDPSSDYKQAQRDVAGRFLHLFENWLDLVHQPGPTVYPPMLPAAQPYMPPWGSPTFYSTPH